MATTAAANGTGNGLHSSSIPKKVICLFDVDGTLTKARQPIEQPMAETLAKLKQKATTGVVSGSDIAKVAGKSEQNSITKLTGT